MARSEGSTKPGSSSCSSLDAMKIVIEKKFLESNIILSFEKTLRLDQRSSSLEIVIITVVQNAPTSSCKQYCPQFHPEQAACGFLVDDVKVVVHADSGLLRWLRQLLSPHTIDHFAKRTTASVSKLNLEPLQGDCLQRLSTVEP
mmetsp:Transcript_14003/g.20693  ORF Transcript_14003/g.20693 Transcript_14003/m.20693 type:complete len:144 (+) Transcript_14003:584-1015(+)